MQVLISVDMEGIAGVVDGDDIRPGHAEYGDGPHHLRRGHRRRAL
jgi:D-aminopeptidase